MTSTLESTLPDHVDEYLNIGTQAEASDIHLSVSSPPTCRRFGTLMPMWENAPLLTAENTEALVRGFLDEQQWARLTEHGDVDFAYTNVNGRFRTSVVRQRLGFDLAFRIISSRSRNPSST